GPIAVWTSVPEAPIHEERNPLTWPREIGSPGKVKVPAPAGKPFTAQDRYHSKFGRRISFTPYRTHDPRACRRWWGRLDLWFHHSTPCSRMSETGITAPTCIDLFAGCGGLSLGLESAGFRPLLFSELND